MPKDDRPDWLKRAVEVWAEDDATVGLPGHESLDAAYRRIVGEAIDPRDNARYDAGDAVFFRVRESEWVCCRGYPGNSALLRITPAPGSPT